MSETQPTPAQQPNVRVPLFLFIGPPQHGKSTARKIFCELTGLRGASCSDVIYALLAHHRKVPEAELRAVEKETLRRDLIEFGDYLCGSIGKLTCLKADEPMPDYFRAPSALVRTLFHAGVRVVDGVRRKLELQEVKDRMEWLGLPVITIWIERPGQPVIADNTEVTKDLADHVLVNDGDPAALKQKIVELLQRLTAKPEVA